MGLRRSPSEPNLEFRTAKLSSHMYLVLKEGNTKKRPEGDLKDS